MAFGTRKTFIGLLLIAVSILIGYVLVEVAYRSYLFYSYAIDTKFVMKIVDMRLPNNPNTKPGNVMGPNFPNHNFTISEYSTETKLVHQHKVTINNLGWISRFPYSAKKHEDEFRIVAIGDSLTACITNEVPWTDVLQDRLNEETPLLEALGVNRITVMNLGVPGASMQYMANPLALIAKRLSADLVIMNIVAEDLRRRHSEDFETLPKETQDAIVGENPESRLGDLEVDGVTIYCDGNFFGYLYDDDTPRDKIRDPNCKISPNWSVEQGRRLTENEVHKIKQNVAKRILGHRLLLSSQPMVLKKIKEYLTAIRRSRTATNIESNKQSKNRVQTFVSSKLPYSDEDDIDIGLRALRVVKQLHKNVLVTHNPLFWHLTKERIPTSFKPFVAAAASEDTEIIDMQHYMPTHLGTAEWDRWYMLPRDGHWSDYGARAYAEAMALVIRDKLIGRGSLQPDKCGPAFEAFLSGQQTLSSSTPNAERLFAESIKLLPANAIKLAKDRVPYKNCGFVADLFSAHATVVDNQGKVKLADKSWKQAMSASREPSRVLMKKLVIRDTKVPPSDVLRMWDELLKIQPANADAYLKELSARNPKMPPSDVLRMWDKVVKTRPADPDVYVSRGDLRVQVGDAKGANEDFSFALGYRKQDIGLYFRRSQARSMLSDYVGAVEDLDNAIGLMQNAGLYVARGNAKMALGRHKEALADFNLAVEMEPEQKEQKSYQVYRDAALRALAH